MASQKHQLPDFLLADLYPNSIVLVEEAGTMPKKPPVREEPAADKLTPQELPAAQAPGTEIAALVKPSKEKKEKTAVADLSGEWYLGNNQKKITIVVNEAEAKYLKDDSFQFLSSILGACKLNMGDVAIVNYGNNPLTYTQLKEKLSPSYLVLFDITAKQVQLSFTVPFYQVQKYDNCQFLLAPSLEKMLGASQDAKLEKSKLWLCLKKMFDIQ